MIAPLSGLTIQSSEAAWAWLKQNWDRINEKTGAGLGMMGYLVSLTIRGLGTPEHVRDVETFFEGKDTSQVDLALAQGLEALKAKIRWAERDGENVDGWLKGSGYEG